jgi:transcriptional regulator with XRE-family HTH domain
LDTNENNFGPRLLSMIEAKHLSLEEFWSAFGISRATAFNWIKRQKPPPSKAHRERLVEFFGQPREYVLFGKVDESKITPKSRSIKYPELPEPDSQPPMVRESASGNSLNRQQVESYLKEYLDLAEQVPGAIEHAYIELTEALSLDKLRRRLQRSQPRVRITPAMNAEADRRIAELRREAEAEIEALSQRKEGERSA